MPIVTATRLRIRKLHHLPAFLWWSRKSFDQAKRAPGHITSALRSQNARTYWTLSAWTDLDTMRRYRSTGAHQIAMRRAGDWAEEVSTVRWESADATLPNWAEAERRLAENPHTLRFD